MKIYLVPYVPTEHPDLIEVCGMDQDFFEKEIIGPFSIDLMEPRSKLLPDILIEMKNMNEPIEFVPDPLIADMFDGIQFDFDSNNQSIGLLIQSNMINQIPKDILGNSTDELIFPMGNISTRNGIVHMEI